MNLIKHVLRAAIFLTLLFMTALWPLTGRAVGVQVGNVGTVGATVTYNDQTVVIIQAPDGELIVYCCI